MRPRPRQGCRSSRRQPSALSGPRRATLDQRNLFHRRAPGLPIRDSERRRDALHLLGQVAGDQLQRQLPGCAAPRWFPPHPRAVAHRSETNRVADRGAPATSRVRRRQHRRRRRRPGCPAGFRPRCEDQPCPGCSTTPPRATPRRSPRPANAPVDGGCARPAPPPRRNRAGSGSPPTASSGSVSVPVLSNTTVSISASRSSAVGDFSSMPDRNSRPVRDHLYRWDRQRQCARASDDQHGGRGQ